MTDILDELKENKRKKQAKSEEYKEAQEAVFSLLSVSQAFDEEVRKDPVRFVDRLLDDFIDMKVGLMEMDEYLERSPNTPYIHHVQKRIRNLLKRFN